MDRYCEFNRNGRTIYRTGVDHPTFDRLATDFISGRFSEGHTEMHSDHPLAPDGFGNTKKGERVASLFHHRIGPLLGFEDKASAFVQIDAAGGVGAVAGGE